MGKYVPRKESLPSPVGSFGELRSSRMRVMSFVRSSESIENGVAVKGDDEFQGKIKTGKKEERQ